MLYSASMVSHQSFLKTGVFGAAVCHSQIEPDCSAGAARMARRIFSAPFRDAQAGCEGNRMRRKVPELVLFGLDISGHPLHNESDRRTRVERLA